MESRSVDARIADAAAEARALLWVISRAREAITERLIERIWGGESLEQEMLRKLSAELDGLPPALRDQIEAQLPAEVLVKLNTFPPVALAAPAPPGPLLAALSAAGLVGREGEGEDAPFSVTSEVKERITAFIEQHPEERGGRTEAEILRKLGERYMGAFEALAEGDESSRELAADIGQRAIRYLVSSGHDALPEVAARMLASAREDELRTRILAALADAADEAPGTMGSSAAAARWNARAAIADGIAEVASGDSVLFERALSLYERSLDEAEEHGEKPALCDATAIGRRWAGTLERAGHRDTARYAFRRSAANARRAGLPRAAGIALELESTRLGIRHGSDLEALAATLDRHIEELMAMPASEGAAAVPEGEHAGEVLARALELGAQLDIAQERWQPALDRLDQLALRLVERGGGDHALALARGQRYVPLARLGRLDEAEKLLHETLAVFVEVGDAAAEVGTRSRLADLSDERADAASAVAAAREALRASGQVESAEMRAGCHENLSTYLDKAGDPEGAREHQLADLVYRVVARLDMSRALQALSLDVLRAAARGGRHALPRLADLLEKQDFASLQRFLEERSVPLAGLQQGIDELLSTVQAGTKTSTPVDDGGSAPKPPAG